MTLYGDFIDCQGLTRLQKGLASHSILVLASESFFEFVIHSDCAAGNGYAEFTAGNRRSPKVPGHSKARFLESLRQEFTRSELSNETSAIFFTIHFSERGTRTMSLSINNNVASLTAQNNLNKTSSMLSKSLERLSSGLKINRGADGPAALVISEQQRAQITGLQTAIANTSKAVSMVQTTEGALNEVNGLLVKIRSLALDSANSAVNDAPALAANQAEVATALATIDRIANNTQFGSKKLLDGSLGATVSRSNVANASNIQSQLTTGLANVPLADGNYQLKITTAFVPAAAAVVATSASTITNTAGAAGTFFNTAAPGVAATSSSGIAVTAGVAGEFFNVGAFNNRINAMQTRIEQLERELDEARARR